MNKERLRKIDNCIDTLKTCIEEEQECYDSHSDAWQEDEKGENSSDWIDAMQEAVDALEGADRL